MSTRQANETPFVEFIDDYFAECDEHLMAARNGLLALEGCIDRGPINRTVLDELFRSFHSVKGLSAMVGLYDAEQLAHQMESYFSALHKDQVRLTMNGLEALIAGVKALEQVIGAFRTKDAAPDIRPTLEKLAALAAQPGSSEPAKAAPTEHSLELSPEKHATLDAAAAAGTPAWQITFVPSPALAERGVNVNSTRQRLQSIGELVHAVPVVLSGGQIAFTFLVIARVEEAVLRSWQDDGITHARYETALPEETAAVVEPVPVAASYSSLAPTNVVRVDLGRLDELMRLVGELVISRARLDEGLKRLGPNISSADGRALQETNQAMERQLRDLRDGVMRVRLVSMREVFARMQFVIRDLTREHGKKVALELTGQEREIDKFIVERMMDPLLHLVRNSVSHGLENPADRIAAGKSAEGKIALRASATGDTILIEVEDDGRGIDVDKVMARGRAAGLVPPGSAASAATLLDVLCAPGFSTRDEADRASGRGVGMAVVRNAVEELGGVLTLDTRLGAGTHFTIQLPLTLAIADALIVSVGGQLFAVPQMSVREVIQIEPTALKEIENNELLPYRAQVLPVVRLAPFFGLTSPVGGSAYALVLGSGLGVVAIVIDRVFGLREVVVRPLMDPLIRVPGIAGATELGDGRLILILDALTLARAARKQSPSKALKSRVLPGVLPALYPAAVKGL